MPLVAEFTAGRLTSDGGLPWLAEADEALGLCAALAQQVREWRRGPITRALVTLLRQRVFQIACGYADQNDATTLRSDPLLKLVCGREPVTGRDLASQPTLSRLENAVDRHTIERLATAFGEVYLRERGRAGRPTRILLEVDGTDDPVHGEQEGAGYHGYYDQQMYFPLLVFDGDTGQPITAVLRPGRIHGSRFAVLVLRRIVHRIRAVWPDVPIELRADSGFALPRLYAWCAANQVRFTVGLIPNPVLERRAVPLLAEAQAQSAAAGGTKVRLADELRYQASTWPEERRVVFKAEVLKKGPNTRFVVTARDEAPLDVYNWYVDRGESENWIKDFKVSLQADRLSDHRFWANAFRLLLHLAAYWLLETLRSWVLRPGEVRMQFDTLRIQLLKIGGWIRQEVDRFRLVLASSHPGEHLWHRLAARTNRPTNPSPLQASA